MSIFSKKLILLLVNELTILIMISKSIPVMRRINIKQCGSLCSCINRLEITSQKPIVNIIDQSFKNFQLREQLKEYNECYKKKMK